MDHNNPYDDDPAKNSQIPMPWYMQTVVLLSVGCAVQFGILLLLGLIILLAVLFSSDFIKAGFSTLTSGIH